MKIIFLYNLYHFSEIQKGEIFNFVLLVYWFILCWSIVSSLSGNVNDVRPMDLKLIAVALKWLLFAGYLFSKFDGW